MNIEQNLVVERESYFHNFVKIKLKILKDDIFNLLIRCQNFVSNVPPTNIHFLTVITLDANTFEKLFF